MRESLNSRATRMIQGGRDHHGLDPRHLRYAVERLGAPEQVDPVHEDAVDDDEDGERQDRRRDPREPDQKESGQSRDDPGDRHRGDERRDDAELNFSETERRIGNQRLLDHQRHREDRREIGTEPHEARMGQVGHVGVAHEDLQPEHQDQVDVGGDGEAHLVGLAEQHDEEADAHREGGE